MPTTFPVLPFKPVGDAIDYEWPSDEFLSASGRGLSFTYWTGPRRHYTFRYELLREDTLAPAPWNGYSEIAALRAVFNQMGGTAGTIQFVDPAGDTVTVKFEAPLSTRKIGEGSWEADVALVEVK